MEGDGLQEAEIGWGGGRARLLCVAHSFGLGQLGDACSVHGLPSALGVEYPYDLKEATTKY